MKYVPYVYSVTHIPSGNFYIGSKYGELCGNTNPSLFWVEGGYFTSSTIIKELLKADGMSAFSVKVRKTFDNALSAQAYEKRFIEKVYKSPKCLNRNIGGVIVDHNNKNLKIKINGVSKYDIIGQKYSAWCNSIDPNTGLSNAQLRGLKLKGVKKKQETIDLVKAKNSAIGEDGLNNYQRTAMQRTGKNNPVHNSGVKEKISLSVKKFMENETPEQRHERIAKIKESMSRPSTVAKMKAIQAENNPARNTNWYNDGLKSYRLHQDDPRILENNLSTGRLNNEVKSGYNYEVVQCPHCGKEGGGGNMKRYHFDNCSQNKKSSIINPIVSETHSLLEL